MHVPPPGARPGSAARLERLQMAADAIPALVSYITADERYAAANRAYKKWFGIEPEEIVGRRVVEIVGDETYKAVLPYIQRVLAGELVKFDLALPFRSGAGHIEATYIPDVAPDGNVVGYIALIHDISERKRLETELRTRAASRATLNRIGHMLAGELDLKRLVQAITDAATELSGAEIGAFFYDTREDDRDAFTLYAVSGASCEAVSRLQMPRNTVLFDPACRRTGIVRIDDVTLDRRYGMDLPYLEMPEGAAPVRSYLGVPVASRSGDALGALVLGHSRAGAFDEEVASLIAALAAQASVAIDNSRLFADVQRQQRETEAGARRSEFLSDAGRALVTSFDVAATCTNVVRLAVQAIGDFCAIEVMDQGRLSCLAAAHANSDRDRIAEQLCQCSPAEEPGAWSVAQRLSGPQLLDDVDDEFLGRLAVDPHHLELLKQVGFRSLLLVPMVVGGRPLGSIALGSMQPGKFTADDLHTVEELARTVALALSNARLYEEAQEANRLKDEFLAIVSHELRTPLNAIRGWTSLLRTAALDERQREHALTVVDRNITAQTQLIEDLLDISRIVSGKMRLNVQPVDLSIVVQAAIDSVRPAAAAKEIRLQPGLDSSAAPVWGDPDRLQQVAWNLLSNAIKFTPKGGRVQVRLHQVNSHVELSVADTGQGISREFLPHVFDRFRQGDSTTTRPVGGLGLGLAIVRHLAELHGGSVDVESPGEGEGSTFTLRLPVMVLHRRLGESGQAGESRRPLTVDRRLDGIRVLCVDDDVESCEVLSMVLTNAGAEVRSALNAPEGLAIVGRWHPHVVLSDVEMPHTDGYSFVQQLRSLEAGSGTRTIAIAVTAYARTEDRVRALSAGFQSHLPKPVEPAELIALLGSLLGLGPAPTH